MTTFKDGRPSNTYDRPWPRAKLKLDPASSPTAANDSQISSCDFVPVAEYAKQIGKTANAVRQQILAGHIPVDKLCYKRNNRWYVHRRAADYKLAAGWF